MIDLTSAAVTSESWSLSLRDFESSTSYHWQAATYVDSSRSEAGPGRTSDVFFQKLAGAEPERIGGLKNWSFSANTRSEDDEKRVNIQSPHGQYSQWGGLLHVPSHSRLQVTLETLDFSYSLLRPCNHHSGLRTAAFEVVNFAPFSQKSLVPRVWTHVMIASKLLYPSTVSFLFAWLQDRMNGNC